MRIIFMASIIIFALFNTSTSYAANYEKSQTNKVETTDVTCTYQGTSYKKGAQLCINKQTHECGRDGWINLKTKC